RARAGRRRGAARRRRPRGGAAGVRDPDPPVPQRRHAVAAPSPGAAGPGPPPGGAGGRRRLRLRAALRRPPAGAAGPPRPRRRVGLRRDLLLGAVAGSSAGLVLLPHALVDDVVALRRLVDWAPAGTEQLALRELITHGLLDRHLRRARRVYAGRHRQVVAALQRLAASGAVAPPASNAGLHV